MAGRDADPVVAIAAPRPDFDGALQEFFIGLLAAALQPADEAAWRDGWRTPPSVDELQAALDALPPAFDLEGEGPRFFQDLSATDFADAEPRPVDQLLVDSPGDQGVALNKDLFVKRARVQRLSRPAAAMALVTMQTYAPAGGQGYRTSMRGGGPLTTLVDPRSGASDSREASLWHLLWANVETREQLAARTPSGVEALLELAFPWGAPTRVSNPKKGGGPTTPSDAPALQAYFGLPRRIRLELGDAGVCDLTGRGDERTVIGFRALNYGVQYDRWKHPLSPHYRQKLGEPWLPMHGQPGGVAWRDWLSLTLDAPAGELREPALVVAHFGQFRARTIGRREFRVHVFGYDMDNMKARAWTESVVPAFAMEDDERRRLLYSTSRALTEATSITGTALLGAVKTALFQSPDDTSGDLGQVRLELWSVTEGDFYHAMRDVADESLDLDGAITRSEEARRAFTRVLETAALAVFDRWCPPGAFDVETIRRRVAARYQLVSALRGHSKLGEALFKALGVAPPGGGATTRATKRAKTSTGRTA